MLARVVTPPKGTLQVLGCKKPPRELDVTPQAEVHILAGGCSKMEIILLSRGTQGVKPTRCCQPGCHLLAAGGGGASSAPAQVFSAAGFAFYFLKAQLKRLLGALFPLTHPDPVHPPVLSRCPGGGFFLSAPGLNLRFPPGGSGFVLLGPSITRGLLRGVGRCEPQLARPSRLRFAFKGMQPLGVKRGSLGGPEPKKNPK